MLAYDAKITSCLKCVVIRHIRHYFTCLIVPYDLVHCLKLAIIHRELSHL